MQEGGGLIGGRAMSQRVKVWAWSTPDGAHHANSDQRYIKNSSAPEAWLVFAPHSADPLAALTAEVACRAYWEASAHAKIAAVERQRDIARMSVINVSADCGDLRAQLAALEAERDEARAFAHAANGTAQRLAGELEEARSGFKGLLAGAAARLSSEDLDRLGNLGQVEFGCWNGLEGPASACAECREAFRRALVAYLVGEQSPLRAGHPDELGGEAS